MSRRGDNIHKRSDGRWEGRYISGRNELGKAVYRSVYAHSYADCSEKLKLARCDLLPVSKPMTVDELFAAWHLSHKNKVKQSTYVNYLTLCNNYLRDRFGSFKVERLNAFMLNRFVDDMLTNGGKKGLGLSSTTMQSVMILMCSVLEYGELEHGLPNAAKHISILKTQTAEISVFNEFEIRRIRNCADTGNRIELGVLLALISRGSSKKIRAVIKAKGERGERISTAIPYGYMKDPNDPKRIIPDPETAPIVKRIFEMSAMGIGIVKICDTLSKEKFLRPSVYLFQKTGNRSGNPNPNRPYHWALTTIRRILSIQVYCGDTVNFKTYSKSNKLKKRLNNSPENILVFKDIHEAIIDRVTFDVVQKHFEGKKRPDSFGNVDKYAGYLFCEECKSRLYLRQGRTIAPENNNYSCSGHSKRTTDCTAHYIRAVVLDEIVLTTLKEMTVFAREHSEEFVERFRASSNLEAKKRLKESEQQKNPTKQGWHSFTA